MFLNHFRLTHGERQVFVDNLQETKKDSDYSLGAEITKKLRNIIEKTEFDKVANIMTEEDVVTEEKRKIQEILRDQFAPEDGSEDDNGSKEMDENSKIDKMIDILSNDMISHTFDEIQRYKKDADSTKGEGKSRKNIQVAVEDSANNESDEL